MKKNTKSFLCVLILAALALPVPAQSSKYQVVGEWRDGRCLVKCESGSFGYISRYNALVVPCQFKKADDFWNGRAAAMDDSYKWGYIDSTGTWLIPPRYGLARPFDKGYAIVSWEMGDDEFLIDSLGQRPFPQTFQTLRYEGNGIYRGEKDGKMGFYKPQKGRELAGGYDATGRYQSGHAFACTGCEWDDVGEEYRGGTWYLVDEKGKEYQLKDRKQRKTPLNRINVSYDEAIQRKLIKKWIKWSRSSE